MKECRDCKYFKGYDYSDGTVEVIPIKNFDFIGDVSITCRYRYDSYYTSPNRDNSDYITTKSY